MRALRAAGSLGLLVCSQVLSRSETKLYINLGTYLQLRNGAPVHLTYTCG
jgi:hypothetical protein